ncbi:MAG: matrixin family metalloprotease [Fimbriimonadaceae bacterium]|nr:matrixin family metalloprotease [Fimbriimonadaceae bacterium]
MRLRHYWPAAIFFAAAQANAFALLSTKWDVGGNAAESMATEHGTPGDVTWSVMGVGLRVAQFDHHNGGATTDFYALTSGDEEAMIASALAKWTAVCGLTATRVADGGVTGGGSQASGAHLGDIRFGSLVYFEGLALAHAFRPNTEAFSGTGGTIGGDVHVADHWDFVDEADDTTADHDFDLYTVLLHEIGHAIGLDHSDVKGSVMEPVYAGSRRNLTHDDVAGAQYIYGAVPEPATMAVLGLGAAVLARRRKVVR